MPKKKPMSASREPVEAVTPVVIDDAPERNAYYDRVARRYRTAQYLTLFLVVAVILTAFVTGSDSITYANFVYLLRDFDTVLSAGGDTVNRIRYSAADERQYLCYRNGLALVNRAGVELYNASGRRTLDDTPGFSDPRAAASAQYMLVWDAGHTSYALYNSLARIYTGELDFPISAGAISDSGMYAVVTKSREYTSAVLLYGKNNRLKNRFLKDEYVIDVAIADDGERVALASVKSADGAYLTELLLAEPGKDTALATVELGGMFPLAVRFFDDNRVALLCDGAICFYSAQGEALGRFTFTDAAPSRFALDGELAALVFPNNVMGTESRVLCFDGNGQTVDDAVFAGRAEAVALGHDGLYLLTENDLYHRAEGKTASLDYSGSGKALLTSGDGVLLCTAAAAYRYDADDFAD